MIYDNAEWSLAGRKVVVTGGADGIGGAIAETFIHLGAEVLIVDLNPLNKDSSILKHPSLAGVVQANVASEAGIAKIVNGIQTQLSGKLDILVNNVGTNIRKSTLEYTHEDFYKIVSVNLESAFNLSRKAYPFLKESKKNPNIVNVGSINSQRVIRFTSAMYTATKAGLEQLSNYLAVEWAPEGIRVNSIHPWATSTHLAADAFHKNPSLEERIAKATPVGRIAEPREVANAAAFLAMPAASYITGVNLPVDGGFSKLGF